MASHSKYSLLLVVLASFGVMLGGVGLVYGLSVDQLTLTLSMIAIGWMFILPLLVTGIKHSMKAHTN